jgi:SAM-dependent methyltransferase
MTLLARAWIGTARARRRLSGDGPADDPLGLLRSLSPGRSVVDVGCMWSVDGAYCFAAEEAGATAVTGVDLMPASGRFEAERDRRSSAVRFLQGDVNDPAVVEEVGEHDLVWCAGVLYHAPNPLLTLERLRALCREQLVLRTAALPELPGAPGACVFYPAGGAAYAPAAAGERAIGLTEPFDPTAAYGNWWWGITPSALCGMLEAAGFVVDELRLAPFHATAIAR